MENINLTKRKRREDKPKKRPDLPLEEIVPDGEEKKRKEPNPPPIVDIPGYIKDRQEKEEEERQKDEDKKRNIVN